MEGAGNRPRARTRGGASMEDSMTEYSDILYGVEIQVATIAINRPKTLNAFTQHTLYEMEDAIRPAAIRVAGRGNLSLARRLRAARGGSAASAPPRRWAAARAAGSRPAP